MAAFRDTPFFRDKPFSLGFQGLSGLKSGVNSPVLYLREYLKKPTEIGAVAPSSDELARAMLEGLDLENARAVVEYGPGNGTITDHIRRKMSPHTKLAAIEINPRMAGLFKERHPDVLLFEDTVANARMICDYAGMDSVDCIVSGLPWATFSELMQVKFLEEMMRILRPGGDFVTFAYVHALREPVAQVFPECFEESCRLAERSPGNGLPLPQVNDAELRLPDEIAQPLCGLQFFWIELAVPPMPVIPTTCPDVCLGHPCAMKSETDFHIHLNEGFNEQRYSER